MYNMLYLKRNNRQIAIAPSGSGKSHMIAALMVMIALQTDNARFLIVYNQ